MSTSIQSLKHKLIGRQQASPLSPRSYFIPADALASLIRSSSVKGVLEELQGNRRSVDGCTQQILASVMKVFAILVYTREANDIYHLLDAGVSDVALPLRPILSDHVASFSDGAQNGSIRSLPQWTATVGTNFFASRWIFLSPVFDTLGQHMELDDHCILPFIDEEVIRSEEGHRTILAVKIHRAHQFLYKPNGVYTIPIPSSSRHFDITSGRRAEDCNKMHPICRR
jgi:hypothetical protein